jgi:DNA polymerase-1
MAKRLYILDAHSLIYQVFHAIAEMTSPDGLPTNAVFGFTRDIEFIRKQKKPDYFLCAMDAPGPTFRHRIADDYKATRAAMPDDLRPQIDVIKRVLAAYRIPILCQEGYEADDYLASVARQAHERGIEAYLCTADKDVRQCVRDGVIVYDLRRNRVIDRQYVVEDWGIAPEQVVDFQSLVGDSTDNIKGVAGVGPKTASKLLQQYATLEGIYDHIDEIKGKLRENLVAGRESALKARDLVRLKENISLPEDWSSWKLQEPDRPALLELFREVGFHRFADDLRAEAPAAVDWKQNYRLVADAESFDELLRSMASQSRISFDLETTSTKPAEADIVGYAVSWTPEEAYYIAVRAPKGQTSLDPDDVLAKMRPILENPEIQKVGQNLKYDMVVLKSAGVTMEGLAFDTMIASYLLEPGERIHNLDELSQRLLGHETIKIESLIGKGKNQLRMDQVDVAKVADYAAEDADCALRLTEILAPRLQTDGVEKLFEELELPLVEVLVDMESAGIRIDVPRLDALSDELGERLDEVKASVYKSAGHPFNVDSPAQVRKVLFEELNLPVMKRTPSGASTDQEVLEELSDRHEVCAMLLEYRQLAKLKGTYLDALPTMINKRTGRVHASFNQTVAATGRLSSSDPNLQNIPIRTAEGQKIRAAFLPGRPTQVLLSADYSQIELRMLAYYSGDQTLCRAFAEDQDIHAVVGAQIGRVSVDQVTAELRRRAKAVNFGIMYGLSPFGLARQLKIDKEEAAAFIDAYFQQYPGVEAFFTRVLEDAKKNRFVSTILGRRRPISGIRMTTGRVRNLSERTAINTVIQGSAADLIKQAMVNLHRRLKRDALPAQLLLPIHDELVFEVDREYAETLANVVVREMSRALPLGDVPVKVDVGVGHNWLDLEPLDVETRSA